MFNFFWLNPDNCCGWGISSRGVGYTFDVPSFMN
jgi:hypothetical protein